MPASPPADAPAPPSDAGTARAPRRRRPAPERARWLGLLAGLGVLALVALASLRIGSVSVDTATVVEAFTAFDGSSDHLIVRTLRLPRTLIGLAVGASLALAGVAMQAVTRNALASPTVLGVNAGAAFGVVLAVTTVGALSPTRYVWFAFAGAMIATLIVFAIASAGRGGATPVRLALAGAVMTALLNSWVWAAMVLNERSLDEVRFWLAGSVAGRDLAVLGSVWPFLLVGALIVVGLTRHLDTLGLGDAVAAGLGQRTGRVRVLALGAAVLLAGSSVAVAGPIGFVGLAVPHAVRSVVGPRHRWLLPGSAIAGATLLLVADVVGRIVMRPEEIQVGIVTAILGAPVLIHLVRGRTVGLR